MMKGRNLFRPSLVTNLIPASSGTTVAYSTGKSFHFKVKSGEIYSFSRNEVTNDRFRITFYEEEPARGTPYVNVASHDTNLKLEGVKVPEGINYILLYIVYQEGEMPSKIKIEKGDKATDWSPAPEDNYLDNYLKSSTTYAHAKLKIDDYWNRGISGQGIKIGIVDDGMAKHDALPIAGGLACGKHTTYMQETEHPAHCAGIALGRNLVNGQPTGIAPDAELYAIRMDTSTFKARAESLIEAIDFAIEEGIDILSMSIHLSENSVNVDDGRGSSKGTPKHLRIPLRNAFYKAYKHGIIICVAAGNHNDGSGKDNIEFEELLPKMPNVLAVANLSMGNERYATSGVGKWVDIAGYGYRIKSTIPGDRYGHLTGTSMSTPQIAGVFALYKQLFTDLTAQEIIKKVLANCKKVEGLNALQQGRGVPHPPVELYDLPVLSTATNNLRIRKDVMWQAVDTYAKIDGRWKEVEAMGFGE